MILELVGLIHEIISWSQNPLMLLLVHLVHIANRFIIRMFYILEHRLIMIQVLVHLGHAWLPGLGHSLVCLERVLVVLLGQGRS